MINTRGREGPSFFVLKGGGALGQNNFDVEEFFQGYQALRKRDDNLNVLLEQPAMKKLLPDVMGKRVLD